MDPASRPASSRQRRPGEGPRAPARPTGRPRGASPVEPRLGRARATTRALVALAEAAAGGLTSSEILALVARVAATLTGDAVVHVWLATHDGRRLTLAAEFSTRSGEPGLPPITDLEVGQGLAGTVARSPEPVVVASLRSEGRILNRAWARRQRLASFAGVRFARGERLLGALCLFTWRRHRFTRAEVDLLRALGAHVAVALDSAALFDTARSRLRRLEALREIEREMSLQRDPVALLGLITRRATELLEADSATVFLLEGGDRLRPRASFNAGPWVEEVVLTVGQGLAGAVAARRQGMVVNDYPRSPFAIPPFRERDTAVVAQPLLVGEALRGVLLVRRAAPGRPFTDADLVQLGDFAVQTSIALDNARLLEVARVRAGRIKAAAEVGQLLAATRDADRIFDLIAEKCRELLGIEAFGLFRLDAGGRYRYARGFGLDPAFLDAHTLAPGEGAVGRAAVERTSVQTEDILADPTTPLSLETRARIEPLGSRAVLAVPIAKGGEVLGVLAAYHPPGARFAPDEVEFLETLANHAATALDNVRLFAEIVRRQETAETLAAITQTLTGSLVRQTVVTLVAEAVRRLLRCEGGAIGLIGSDGAIRMSARVGLGAEAFRDVVVGPGEGVTAWVVAHGQPLWTSSYASDPRITPTFAAQVRAAGIVSLVAVPVRLGDETVGVLYGFYDRAVAVTDEDLALATDLARVVAVAVANARLYHEARQREAEARALFEVGRRISGTLDAELVLDLIVEKALELMRVRACGIFRLDPDGWLRYARGAGLSPAFVQGLRVRPGQGSSGRAVGERRPVWTADILGDPDIDLDEAARGLVAAEGYRAVLSAPIERQGTPFGCLAVYWWEPHVPGPAEIETLSSLATLAAVAMENARLYHEAQVHEAEAVALAEASRRFNAILRREAILDALVEAAGRLVPGTWWVAPAGGGDDEGSDRVRAAAARAVAEAPARSGQWRPVRRVDGLDPGHPARADLARAGIREVVAVPIGSGRARVTLMGAVRADGRPLTEREVRLVEGLADRAGTALENARLFEELTQAYQDLKAAQEQLVRTEKLRALGEMASGVAHDFNNLLAAILGRVQLMLRKVEDPTLRRWLQIIEQAALDGAQTVRQIQEFTRVRRDEPTQTVALDDVVRDAVEMTRPRWHGEAHSRGLTIQVVEALEPVPAVDGHPAELREVLTNLILNAVDALPRGGTITVATRSLGETVEASVVDNGVGMSEAVRRRIFEPFFTTKGPRGTGLGLAMVYGIVTRHRGEIQVESQEGVGSRFTVRLPVGRPASARLLPSSAPAAAGGRRVLVIDDEPAVREMLADLLRLLHHDVVVASDGAEGLARFREAPFDLVMTDLAMPGMSGWQVALGIKALRPEVPVVLVTGWGVEVPGEQLGQSGVARVMTKPFRYEEVQAIVGDVLHARAEQAAGSGEAGSEGPA